MERLNALKQHARDFRTKITSSLTVKEDPSRRTLIKSGILLVTPILSPAKLELLNEVFTPIPLIRDTTEIYSLDTHANNNQTLSSSPASPSNPTHVRNRREQETHYRSLVVIYADGLNGGGPKGRPFYDGIHALGFPERWENVEPNNPNDPNILEWKRKTKAKVDETIASGSDIDFEAYSAGAGLIASLGMDMCNPNSEFYTPDIAQYTNSITLYAPPDVTDPNSAHRSKLETRPNYQQLFGHHTLEDLQRFKDTFAGKLTVFVGQNDTELRLEGIALAIKLGVQPELINTDHGMQGVENKAVELFKKHALEHRKKQNEKIAA